MAPLRRRMIMVYRSLGARQLAGLGAASIAGLAVVLIAILAGGGSDKVARPHAELAVSPAGSPPSGSPPSGSPPAVRRHRERRGVGSRAQTRHAGARRPAKPHASSPARRSPAGPTSQARAAGGAKPATSGKHTAAKHPARKHTATRAPAGPSSITFAIKGGGDTSVAACGATHHYRTYAAGSQVRFAGTVNPIPSGRWKVKLKVKVCAGGSFAPFAKFDALRNKHRGTFGGVFTAPPAGLYAVRATLYINGSLSADSLKHHFQTH